MLAGARRDGFFVGSSGSRAVWSEMENCILHFQRVCRERKRGRKKELDRKRVLAR